MDRFWNKVEKTDACWVWVGARIPDGYGMLYYEGKNQLAHRVSWWLDGRVIPDGLQLDHLCRNRACVRPDHLEAVTPLENSRRGMAGAKNRNKTHCKHGHQFTEANTGRYGGKRYCRKCRARWQKENRYGEKKKLPLKSG